MYSQSTTKRFWSKVKKTTNCWEWKAYRQEIGYGCFSIGSRKVTKTRRALAHRISWQISFGEIPKNMFVLHKCDNRSCVRPSHLFLGTQLDNMRDASKKGRLLGRNVQRGEARHNAKLSSKDVLKIRSLIAKGIVQRRIAEQFGVCFQTITLIKSNKIWKHV